MPTFERTAHRQGETAPVSVAVRTEPPGPDGGFRYAVSVTLGGLEHAATADDAFEALATVRLSLERDGWLLGVEGARIDVWPSGMARDQGGGLRAYRLHAGRGSTSDDPIDVFAVATERLATVADQRAAAVSALSTPRWVDEDSSESTSGAPDPRLAPVRGWRAAFRRSVPSLDEQWAEARSLRGDAQVP